MRINPATWRWLCNSIPVVLDQARAEEIYRAMCEVLDASLDVWEFAR